MNKEPVSGLVTGHKAVRDALRDTATYSSDLQGDADVRDYRQLPLEVDPPRHHLYRTAVTPYFVKPTVEKSVPKFREHAESLVREFFAGSPKDVISNLALPLVMRNLGVLYHREQDVDEWISWGPDVWTAGGPTRDGAVLHAHLDRIYAEAVQGSFDDVWREIAHLEIEGRQISPIEFRGIAGVLLAGGRDTVVKLFTGIMWHFARVPEDLERLRREPQYITNAIQEFLRYLTPLPQMSRTTVPEGGATDLPKDRYVGISFISGNFDDTVFAEPLKIDLTRERNPHLSFGFGPHTCLGNHVAEIEARVFLETLLASDVTWEILAADIRLHPAPYEGVPDNFHELVVQRRG